MVSENLHVFGKYDRVYSSMVLDCMFPVIFFIYTIINNNSISRSSSNNNSSSSSSSSSSTIYIYIYIYIYENLIYTYFY